MLRIVDLPRIVSVQTENGINKQVVLSFDAYRDFVHKLMFHDDIDEQDYLDRYSDVREAVEQGKVSSASYHFKAIGYVEGRKFRPKA
jgi:hypothetical protein